MTSGAAGAGRVAGAKEGAKAGAMGAAARLMGAWAEVRLLELPAPDGMFYMKTSVLKNARSEIHFQKCFDSNIFSYKFCCDAWGMRQGSVSKFGVWDEGCGF